jgi:hypothetical protein
MSHHDHAHGHRHHHPGHVHPPAAAPVSILRLPALHRVAVAAGAIALLWLLAFWAMR